MPSNTIAKVAGLLLGATAAAVVMIGWRIPGPEGALGATLTLNAAPTGELGVAPTGAILRAADLAPGSRPVRGSLMVRNQTGATLVVGLRAKPVGGDLDDVVRVRITTGGIPLFDGALGGLRAGMRRFTLAAGTARRLRFEVTLPRSRAGGSEGRSDDVALELRSRPTRLRS